MMTRRLLFVVVSLMLLIFMLPDTPLPAQENTGGDIADVSLDELLNVKITTAGKKAEKISEIPASVVLITREDIQRYGYTSLEDVLKNVAGVYAIDDMSYLGTSLGIRGFYSVQMRNIIFMVNGVHQVEPYWKASFLRLFQIPIEAIDRIEVVRGPMSVIYGSGAFFGAINIITNQNTGDKNYNVVSASGGSLNTVRTAVRFSGGKEGEMNYAVSAGYTSTDGPNEPLSKMSTGIPEWMGINDSNNSTKDRLEQSNKYVNLSLDYKGFYSRAAYAETIEENYIILPSVSRGNHTIQNFTVLQLGYKKALSDKFSLDGSISYHKYYSWVDWDIFDPSYYGYELGQSEEFEADVTGIYTPTTNINITSGVHISKITNINYFDLVPSFPYNVNYLLPKSINTRALFSQADFSLTKNLRLIAGLRLEQQMEYRLGSVIFNEMNVSLDANIEGTYDNSKIQVIPRAALIYSINDKNYIKLLYGKAIRFPEFQPNLENLIAEKPDLKTENINTIELNYITSPSSKITMNFSIFFNRLKNLVARTFEVDQAGSFVTYYSNAGSLETIGGELSILTKPIKNLTIELSGTYQKTKNKREGLTDIEPDYSPKMLGHVKAAYRFGRIATFALTGRYIDKMYPKWDITIQNEDGSYGARIGQPVKAYFVLDGNLRFDHIFGKEKDFYLTIKCTNIFDQEYLYPANENNIWADLGTIGRGIKRAFMIGLGKEF